MITREGKHKTAHAPVRTRESAKEKGVRACQREREPEKETDSQADSQIDLQKDRTTEKRAGRQIDRARKCQRQRQQHHHHSHEKVLVTLDISHLPRCERECGGRAAWTWICST